MPLLLNKKPRILIINPFGIGDVLFTTPLIRALKDNFPDAFIGFWSNLRVRPVLISNPGINKVFTGNRGDLKKLYREAFFKGLLYSLKLFWEIKRGRFDICFDFSLDHRYGFFTKMIGIKKRIGFNYKGRGRFLTDRIDITGYQEKHVIDYYLELLKFLGISAQDKKMSLSITSSVQLKADGILASFGVTKDELVIGIVPGAGGSWGKDAAFKHWPALKFAQTADLLINKFKAKILILGDESEQKISDEILLAMENKAVDLAGRISLEIFPAIIKRCELLITNDGGPMHLAVALGVKSVSVFGPVSEISYGPFPADNNNIVLKEDLSCRPCYRNFRLNVCDRDRECLRSLSADKVLEASSMLLG